MEADFTSAASRPGIVLYDVAFARPYEENTSAPNPWKARYALNFKGVPYSTQWVQMPDITKVRRSLGIPACRKFADGTDFYTLPIVTDSKTAAVVGDSFDIANYLQNTYPDAGAGDLFPSQQLDYVCPGDSLVPLSEQNDSVHADYARFNTNVDMAFSVHAQLMATGMRWDPAFEDEIKAEFLRRSGMKSWDDMAIDGEARDKLKGSLRDALRDLAAMLQRDATGPFMLGATPSYADIIVGAWLRMMSKTVPEGEWEEVQTWHDGVFGKLHAALQQRFGDVK
jgi:glutathione S-transferase